MVPYSLLHANMAAAELDAPRSTIELEVRRIQALLRAGRLDEALAAAEGLRAEVPENRDVLYMIAVSLRYLPRSGSTLIEQILSSHSRVEGTMELADIPRLAQELKGRETVDAAAPRYPGVLAELHLGLIHLMLPDAKIIDARREPIACCFSNYKQLFASGQQFTSSIADIARYYGMYVEHIAHWTGALPGRILRVQHQEVVDDLEANVQRILEFCELDFEPGCVEFYKTARSVHSASSEQVRRPIDRAGVDQWRHYRPWLGPLRDALGALGSGSAHE